MGLIPLKAQKSFTENFVEQFQQFQLEQPLEKAYLHTDRYYYIPGESVWISAFLVDGRQHLPTYISQVLYVDLIGPADTLIQQLTLKVVEGRAEGDWVLPASTPAGSYRLRAYTQWMRNTETDFQTSIRVLRADVQSIPPNSRKAEKPDLQFLPEGGTFIAGLTQNVAIKALNPQGLGVNITGKVHLPGSEGGDTLLDFSAGHLGMGFFTFQPEAGQRYLATIRYRGDTYTYALPKVASEGFALEAASSTMLTQVKVMASPTFSGRVFHLAGIQQGEIRLLTTGKINPEGTLISIPNIKFKTGVLQLTLFDESGAPQAERLVFVDRQDRLQVFLEGPEALSAREKATWQVKVQHASGEPVAAQLSFSVADESALSEGRPDRQTLASHLWLGSELTGFVESPEQYFQPGNAQAAAHLDLVMMTHGWRTYDWQNLLQGQFPETPYLIEQGLTVSGQVTHEMGRTLKNGPVTLMMGNFDNFLATETDEEGRFLFGGLDFVDSTQLILQAKSPKGKIGAFNFILDTPTPYPVPAYPDLSALPHDPQDQAELLDQASQQIKVLAFIAGTPQYEMEAIAITAKQKSLEEETEPYQIYTRADVSLAGEDLPINQNIFEAIRGRIPNVQVSGGYGSYSVNIRGINSLSGSNEPLYLLNGMPADVDLLMNIPMAEVKKIDVLKGTRAAIFGSRGQNGVIAVYTKQGTEAKESLQDYRNGVYKPNLTGYHIPRKFYAPRYDRPQTDASVPDMRTTIHWAPVVETDDTGAAEATFFHSDVPGQFQVRVEVLSANGQPGYATATYKVKP